MSGSATTTGRRVWAALVAPPIAWAVQSGVGFVCTDVACNHHAPGLARAAPAVLALLAFAAALASLLVAVREVRGVDRDGRTRASFLAVVAMVCSIVFGLGVIWSAVPFFVLSDVCEGER